MSVDSTCLLFTYGLLQPGYQPPETMVRSWADEIRGELFDLGEYPGAIAVGTSELWLPGHVLEIASTELTAIDAFEETHTGEYARIISTTRQGHEVFVYEYRFELPRTARRVDRWPVSPA